VVWTTRKGFGGNRSITIEIAATPHNAAAIVLKAFSQLGQPYNVFHTNCEHVAREAAMGRRESKQLQTATVLTLVVAAVGAAVANENGTYVDGYGYRRDSRGQFAKRRWIR